MFQPVVYYAINPLHSQANSCIDWSPVNYTCTIQQPPILMMEKTQIPLHSHRVLSWLVIGLRTALCLWKAEAQSYETPTSVHWSVVFFMHSTSGPTGGQDWRLMVIDPLCPWASPPHQFMITMGWRLMWEVTLDCDYMLIWPAVWLS